MPTIELVNQFITSVEKNEHDKSIEEYYHINATMQENNSEPRVGRDKLITNEKKVLNRVKTLTSKCIKPFFINGDYVVIRWEFCFNWIDGTTTEIEEIAHQRWHKDQIIEEKFFYDPKQTIPK